MPRGDRTGPAGMGPKTGRSAGYCAGYDRPGFANPVSRRGFGIGRGFRGIGPGRGFGRGIGRDLGWSYANYALPPYQNYRPTEKEELDELKAEKEIAEKDINAINEEIKAIEKRIKDLEKPKKR